MSALDEISLAIPAGASVALLGPNGAGKSTLFMAAVGLVAAAVGLDPNRGRGGRIRPSAPLDRARVPGHGARRRAHGALPRGRLAGSLYAPHDHELVDAALARLGVEALAERRFGDLSGGQRQRVLLAQATAQEADLLLLDEPFTGVDRPTHETVRELLASWREERRTVIVATHDLESAARDYDLVLALNRRLVALGPPAEVCTETVLADAFAGHVVRVGELIVDVTHHHHGAG